MHDFLLEKIQFQGNKNVLLVSMSQVYLKYTQVHVLCPPNGQPWLIGLRGSPINRKVGGLIPNFSWPCVLVDAEPQVASDGKASALHGSSDAVDK